MKRNETLEEINSGTPIDSNLEKLLKLIEIFNLTREYQLPNFDSMQREEIEKLGTGYDAEIEYQAELMAIKKLALQIEHVPGLFSYLGFSGRKAEEISKDENELGAFRFFYQMFLIHRNTLQSIIKRLERLRKNNVLPPKQPLVMTLITAAMAVTLNPDNSVSLGASSFEFFAIEDQRRLKKCDVCGKIFWAFRLNTQTCSIKCANTRRQRNYRSTSKTKEE